MIIKKCRTTWNYLFDKKQNPFGGENTYESTIIISKNDTATLKLFEEAIVAAKNKAKEMYTGVKGIDALEFQLRDGDSETDNPKHYEFLKNSYFFTAKNKKDIEVYKAVKQDDKVIKVAAEKTDTYNGMNAAVICNPFVYNANRKLGITMYLNGIIQLPGGERLSTGNSIQDIEIDIEDWGLARDDKNDDDWTVL